MTSWRNESSFTLIELLVVIAILGVLATAVILVINPAELLKEARDSTRLSDLASLNSALNLFQVDQYNQSLGTASTTYVSVPDTSPTCANLGLPALPSGWAYACVSTASSSRVDGTGWIPVNFTLISSGSPLSRLPIDPINTTSSGQYYTYTSGGSWELTAIPESQKQRAALQINPPIQNMPGVIAYGSNLSLSPLFNTSGLVGYWPLDGSPNDSSGNGNNGTWYGSLTNGSYYTGGKIGQAGNFDGTDDYVSVPDNLTLRLNSDFTISLWYKEITLIGSYPGILVKGNSGVAGQGYLIFYISNGTILYKRDNISPSAANLVTTSWNFLTITYSGSIWSWYLNGMLKASGTQVYVTDTSTSSLLFGKGDDFGSGVIDDVRIYNRALSAAEIQAIYNTTK